MSIPFAVSDAAAIASAFGAALLGAVVGGVLTAWATRKLEQERREHQDERERRAVLRDVRALALVEIERYLSANSIVKLCRKRESWAHASHPAFLAVSTPDQRLQLARHMSDAAWDKVTNAEVDLMLLIQAIELVGGKMLSAEDRETLDGYEESFDQALSVFAVLSKATELDGRGDEDDEEHEADVDQRS